MDDRMKQALMMGAKEMYDDPNTETPGSFDEFFQGQFVDEVRKSGKGKQAGNGKQNGNAAQVDKYMAMLAAARGNQDIPEQDSLLAAIQGKQKGPYPANPKEDEHLVAQIMKFIHSQKIQDSVFKMMKSAKNNLSEMISQTSAHISAKLLFEARKQREVTEPTEAAVLRISIEELWTIAKNLGLKKIPKEVVDNSTRVAQGMFDQLEAQMKGGQGAKPQQQMQQMPQQQGGLLG